MLFKPTTLIALSVMLLNTNVSAGFFDNLADNLKSGNLEGLITDAVTDIAKEVAKGAEEIKKEGTSFGVKEEQVGDSDDSNVVTATNSQDKEPLTIRREVAQILDTRPLRGPALYYKKEDKPYTGETWSAQGKTDSSYSEMFIKDGFPDGKTTVWWNNGFKKLQRTVVNGEYQEGEEIRWDSSGFIQSSTFYKKNKRHGIAQEWNRLGNLVSKKEYSDGVLVKDLFLESKNKDHVVYKKTLLKSKVKDYENIIKKADVIDLLKVVFKYDNGIFYDDGKPVSKFINLDVKDKHGNKHKLLEAHLIDGQLEGRSMLYKYGELRSEQDWIKNKQNGLYSLYKRSFKLINHNKKYTGQSWRDNIYERHADDLKYHHHLIEQRVDGLKHGYSVLRKVSDGSTSVIYFGLYNKDKLYYGELLDPKNYYTFDALYSRGLMDDFFSETRYKTDAGEHFSVLFKKGEFHDIQNNSKVNIVGSIDKPNGDYQLDKLLCETKASSGSYTKGKCKDHMSESSSISYSDAQVQDMIYSSDYVYRARNAEAEVKRYSLNGVPKYDNVWGTESTIYYPEGVDRKLPLSLDFLTKEENDSRDVSLHNFYAKLGFELVAPTKTVEETNRFLKFDFLGVQKKMGHSGKSVAGYYKVTHKEAEKIYEKEMEALRSYMKETKDHKLAAKIWFKNKCNGRWWGVKGEVPNDGTFAKNCWNLKYPLWQGLGFHPIGLERPGFKKLEPVDATKIKDPLAFKYNPIQHKKPRAKFDTSKQIGNGESCTYLTVQGSNFNVIDGNSRKTIQIKIKKPDGSFTENLTDIKNICVPYKFKYKQLVNTTSELLQKYKVLPVADLYSDTNDNGLTKTQKANVLFNEKANIPFTGYHYTTHFDNDLGVSTEKLKHFESVVAGKLDFEWTFHPNGLPRSYFKSSLETGRVIESKMWDEYGYLLSTLKYDANTKKVLINEYFDVDENRSFGLPEYKITNQLRLYDDYLLITGEWLEIVDKFYMHNRGLSATKEKKFLANGTLVDDGEMVEFWPNGAPRLRAINKKGELYSATSYYPFDKELDSTKSKSVAKKSPKAKIGEIDLNPAGFNSQTPTVNLEDLSNNCFFCSLEEEWTFYADGKKYNGYAEYYHNGRLDTHYQIVNGVPVFGTQYYSSGEKLFQMEVSLNSGKMCAKPNTTKKYFYKSGALKAESLINEKGCMYSSFSRKYHENGQISAEGVEMPMSGWSGVVKFWDANGNGLPMKKYANGTFVSKLGITDADGNDSVAIAADEEEDKYSQYRVYRQATTTTIEKLDASYFRTSKLKGALYDVASLMNATIKVNGDIVAGGKYATPKPTQTKYHLGIPYIEGPMFKGYKAFEQRFFHTADKVGLRHDFYNGKQKNMTDSSLWQKALKEKTELNKNFWEREDYLKDQSR